jgi:hypothetical protein
MRGAGGGSWGSYAVTRRTGVAEGKSWQGQAIVIYEVTSPTCANFMTLIVAYEIDRYLGNLPRRSAISIPSP